MSPKMAPEKKAELLALFKGRHETPAANLVTIDTMKGIAIMVMLYIHLAWRWRALGWFSLLRLEWYFTDFFLMAFVALSAVGTMMAHYSRVAEQERQHEIEHGQQRGHGHGGLNWHELYPRKKLLRASFLFWYGEILNIMFYLNMGIFHLTGWNVITTIALFSLLLPLMLQLKKITRVCIAVALALTYYPLCNWAMGAIHAQGININDFQLAYLQDPRNLVYWLLFNHSFMTPVYSWLIVPLLVSVIFEPLVKKWTTGARDGVATELKRIGLAGVLLIVVGVATGFWLTSDYSQGFFAELMRGDNYIKWPFPQGMFVFLTRHLPQYIFYNLGIVCVLFYGIGWWQLVRCKSLFLQAKIDVAGRHSLTIYALSNIGFLIPITLTMGFFFVVFVAWLLFVIGLIWYLDSRHDGIGTLEWLADVYTNLISYAMDQSSRGAGRKQMAHGIAKKRDMAPSGNRSGK
jgi:hypothetical protein